MPKKTTPKQLAFIGDIIDQIPEDYTFKQLDPETELARIRQFLKGYKRDYDAMYGPGAYDRAQKDAIHQMAASIHPHH